ncbi:hypothetical protein C8F04DRAFT_1188169 [Mycena alexandri]|uniref:Uncharacterized protein n=1 Tax=Mycena alexandri TaxID=1745969 RepID=A0AAD6WZ58_9AGAR|nr:hypothetical protein C8F04DRAFT_1188169 [Mycena alexandri]
MSIPYHSSSQSWVQNRNFGQIWQNSAKITIFQPQLNGLTHAKMFSRLIFWVYNLVGAERCPEHREPPYAITFHEFPAPPARFPPPLRRKGRLLWCFDPPGASSTWPAFVRDFPPPASTIFTDL